MFFNGIGLAKDLRGSHRCLDNQFFFVIFLSIFRQHIGFHSVFNGQIGLHWFFHGLVWFFFGRIGLLGFFTDWSGFSSDGFGFFLRIGSLVFPGQFGFFLGLDPDIYWMCNKN